MGRTLEARIKRAAHKVLRRERELDEAQKKYQELLDEAYQRGVDVPRTMLSNPLMQKNR